MENTVNRKVIQILCKECILHDTELMHLVFLLAYIVSKKKDISVENAPVGDKMFDQKEFDHLLTVSIYHNSSTKHNHEYSIDLTVEG